MVSSGNQSSDDMSSNITSMYHMLHGIIGISQCHDFPCMYCI